MDKQIKAKLVSLDEMKINLMMDTRKLKTRERSKFNELFSKNMMLDDDELTKIFNIVCLEGLFDTNHYDRFPIRAEI